MRLAKMDITFKFTCGLVNVEQSYQIEFEPNERVDMTKWIIEKATLLEQAGMRPAVVKDKQHLGSPTARAHGANGQHPDDLNPALDTNGKQKYCPWCKEPLYYFSGISKTGKNKGQPWERISHAREQNLKCDYQDWGD
jgi:hypothetical protein